MNKIYFSSSCWLHILQVMLILTIQVVHDQFSRMYSFCFNTGRNNVIMTISLQNCHDRNVRSSLNYGVYIAKVSNDLTRNFTILSKIMQLEVHLESKIFIARWCHTHQNDHKVMNFQKMCDTGTFRGIHGVWEVGHTFS